MKHALPSLTLCCLALFFTSCKKPNAIVIIPEPVECMVKHGNFTIDDKTALCFENIGGNNKDLMHIIKDTYAATFHRTPNLGSKDSFRKNCILFELNQKDDGKLGTEGYRLTVTPRHVVATANTTAGLFYAMQSIMQMAWPDVATEKSVITLPCAKIVDYPRFPYRGVHIDVSRHFFDTAFIKKYIDVMAMYKLNKFHWHLTDDHGWRIQIDKYPLLTEVGAWRPDRDTLPWDDKHPVMPGEPATYGGFYTKEQIREIVKYAAQRHIDIIPEIELPGHCCAILAAYPQFACDNYPYTVQVGPYWPPKAIMCAGNDDVLTFYRDVLTEVAALFPYSCIHIGGDEAVNTNWQNCPKCQKRIHEKGLAGEFALQQWLMDEIEQFLSTMGKKAVIWDDIVSDDMTSNAVITCWRGIEHAVTAARHGNDVIMCPTDYCYFDYYQADKNEEPIAIGGYVPLGKVYDFDPMPEGLSEAEANHILGGQCNLWTEYVRTPAKAEYMLLPRLCALSECVWTPTDRKNWNNFVAKVELHQHVLQQTGYNCSSRREKQ